MFNVFTTQQRFLSPFQLLVKNKLFQKSSFYLKNIVSSFQLLFKKSYLHISPVGKVRGNVRGECLRPGQNTPTLTYLIIQPPNLKDTNLNNYSIPSWPSGNW